MIKQENLKQKKQSKYVLLRRHIQTSKYQNASIWEIRESVKIELWSLFLTCVLAENLSLWEFERGSCRKVTENEITWCSMTFFLLNNLLVLLGYMTITLSVLSTLRSTNKYFCYKFCIRINKNDSKRGKSSWQSFHFNLLLILFIRLIYFYNFWCLFSFILHCLTNQKQWIQPWWIFITNILIFSNISGCMENFYRYCRWFLLYFCTFFDYLRWIVFLFFWCFFFCYLILKPHIL